MSGERRYNEHELRQLMRRATEKQRQSDERDASGLSLEEIKRIAEEIGVNSRFVELAAAELGDDAFTARRGRIMGANHQFSIRRRIRGNLDGQSMAAIAGAIRHRSKSDPGRIETLGDSMHWRTGQQNATRLQVTVAQDGEDCVVEASASLGTYAILLNIPTFILSFIALMATVAGGEFLVGSILLGIAAVLFVTMRFVFGSIVRDAEANMEGAVNDIERILAARTDLVDRADILDGQVNRDRAERTPDARSEESDILRDAESFGPSDGKARVASKQNKSWL